MNIYWSFDDVKFNPDTILTVGTFDGMHLGHQSIITELLSQSSKSGLRNFLLTFHPHPQQVVKKEKKDELYLLTTIEERLSLIEKAGVDNVLVIPFTLEFSQTSHDTFVRKYLFQKVGMKKILVGYDHMFGKNREGNRETLAKLGLELGFEVINMSAKENQNLIISSTKIRHLLLDRNISLANDMLGYSYSVSGLVVEGDKRGMTIGYPTANIELKEKTKLIPGNGVYITRVMIDNKGNYGMTSIGIRPTFGAENKRSFETYILDFDNDIYGKEVKIDFLEFIRDELKFDTVEKLVEAIRQDEKISRDYIRDKQN